MKKMDFEARHLIEALRSGVPSRAVGRYFSSSRKNLLNSIENDLENVKNGESEAKVIIGKYGEGKTHLLNTVFSLGAEKNYVVSLISLSKENPPSNLKNLYTRVIENTYLPQKNESGIFSIFENISKDSDKAKELYEYTLHNLSSDKLYFVLKAFLFSKGHADDDVDDLEADLLGHFINQSALKRLYTKYCDEKPNFRDKFTIKNNTFDYFAFMSKLFKVAGYSGWIILFDEAELIGRLAKKSRELSYLNIYKFLQPSGSVNMYSLFAFSSSFADEVIAGKNEFSAISLSSRSEDEKIAMAYTLDRITKGEELSPLTDEELSEAIRSIIRLYKRAYSLDKSFDEQQLFEASKKSGFLLRTKIRAVIEALDQIYQYGDMGEIEATKVDSEDLSTILDSFFEDGEEDL